MSTNNSSLSTSIILSMNMCSHLFLGLWAIAAAATAMDCPPLAILGDLKPQPGPCLATNICVSEDGTASVYDNNTNSEASCTTTIVALRCSYRGQFVGCPYSILEFESEGAMTQTCCIDINEQVQHYEKPQQLPLGGEDEHLGLEVPMKISNEKGSFIWESDQWNHEEFEGLDSAAEHWESQDDKAELLHGEYFEPEGDEEWEPEGDEGLKLEFDGDSELEEEGHESETEEFVDWDDEWSEDAEAEDGLELGSEEVDHSELK